MMVKRSGKLEATFRYCFLSLVQSSCFMIAVGSRSLRSVVLCITVTSTCLWKQTEFSLLSARNQHCADLPLCSYPTPGIMCNGYKNALVNVTLKSNSKYYSA
jgi:hypothetical protein